MAEMAKNTLSSFEDAEKKVFNAAADYSALVEYCPLNEVYERVLGKNLLADDDQPLADNSAMDGYCFRRVDAELRQKNGLIDFPVEARILAGHPVNELSPGFAAYIATGGIIPSGVDCIVKIEDAIVSSDKKTIQIKSLPKPGTYIRRRGRDLNAGDCVLPIGEKITPFIVGIIASMGFSAVPVFRKPLVAIMTSGDEVVMPFQKPEPWQVRNSNSATLFAQVQEAGGKPIDFGIMKDDQRFAERAINEVLEYSDLLVTSGGVSLGEKDPFIAAFESLGVQKVVHGVSIKPGKPFFFGLFKGKPIFGLPGNQASCAVTFELFVRPFLQRILKCSKPDRITVSLKTSKEIKNDSGRTSFVRGKITVAANGEMQTEFFSKQDSHLLSSFSGTQSLSIIPADLKEVSSLQSLKTRLLL
ncbi:MAG: molybdopterin molybdotransferase MoeA [Candidatus Riflebacteria bacterium]|nr:molybdopterin molybdotransferase MoeA [Candidatus Riflebacteria bacterium]